MRGTKAKAIRRAAREMTAGKPDRKLVAKLRHGQPECAVNHPQTTRGAYLRLKKEHDKNSQRATARRSPGQRV